MVKMLHLDRGEAGYIAVREGSQIVTEETHIRQKGYRLVLVKTT